MGFDTWKLIIGSTATLALYSILYRENKFYRLFEHIFLGLAVGFSVYALWGETLEKQWWQPMVGSAAAGTAPEVQSQYLLVMLLPIGLLGYAVFSKKYSWASRVPIGIILGLWGGQQLGAFKEEFMPQIQDSARVLFPTTFASITVPNGVTLSPEKSQEIAAATGVSPDAVQRIASNIKLNSDREVALAQEIGVAPEQIGQVKAQVRGIIGNEVYPTQAINNFIYILTLISVMSYFLFSIKLESKFMSGFTRAGRLLLMVGFGAIFGSTVMTRFALLIDRMYFIFIETLRDGIFRMGGG